MKDINKSEKMNFLNTKIYITKGDFEIKTGEFYDVVNGKILLDSIDPNSTTKYKIPLQTTFKNEFELQFYLMDYERRKRIATMLDIEPLGWSYEGIEYIDINDLIKYLIAYNKNSSKAYEIFLKHIFKEL